MHSAHMLAEAEQVPGDSAKAVTEPLNASSALMPEAWGETAAQPSISAAAPGPRSSPATHGE